MRIRKVSVDGFKNLSFNDLAFTKATLVHGDNGIGKSNLLQLLHTCCAKKEELEERDAPRFPIEGYVPGDILFRGDGTERQSGTVTLQLSCWSDEFKSMRAACIDDGEDAAGSNDAWLTLEFSRYSNGAWFTVKTLRVGDATLFGDEDDDLDAEEQSAIEEWISEDVEDATTYVPTGRLLRRDLVPMRVKSDLDAVDDLENTVLRLLTSRDEDPAVLDSIQDVLSEFFSIKELRSIIEREDLESGGDEDEEGEREEPEVKVGVRLKEASEDWFELSQVGTGIQQVLVIITMLRQDDGRIALVEEFDSSLSPENRSKLLHQLQNLIGTGSPLRQLIATSHNVFKPKQDNISSVGPSKPGKEKTVAFKIWEEKDWKAFRMEA